jgi:hypothetical protein
VAVTGAGIGIGADGAIDAGLGAMGLNLSTICHTWPVGARQHPSSLFMVQTGGSRSSLLVSWLGSAGCEYTTASGVLYALIQRAYGTRVGCRELEQAYDWSLPNTWLPAARERLLGLGMDAMARNANRMQYLPHHTPFLTNYPVFCV